MNKPMYQIQKIDESSYSFLSIGKNGIILKVAAFTEIESGIVNFGFGDYDFTTETVNDKSVSDNGDAEKILATVVGIIDDFLNKNPMATIYITGSSLSRTRLYQIAIATYFDEFSNRYEILGNYQDMSTPFEKNTNYESFLIRKLL